MTAKLSATGITRTFLDLSEKDLANIDFASLAPHLGISHGTTWDDLLTARRILIVSEAGVGKTFECRACRDRLWANGEPAFFLELSVLADTDVADMLAADEQVRFDAWLLSQSETATFFLNSIDELRISQKSFEQALKRLGKALTGHLGRARIVITTRPIPVDQQLIERHLPIPLAAVASATANEFADLAMSGKQTRSDNPGQPALKRNVGLMPLTREQIRAFAEIQKVTDPDALLQDIELRDAGEYAQRPQDLIELCSDWKDHQRIRNHGDQVATNAVNKLKARTDRLEKAQLSPERALEGASRLALAMLLTRKFTIRYSAESDKLESTEAALDAGKILTNWSQDERDTLLERALFGFANYGRVRFHHRSVIEFLAARRLDALLQRRVPIKAIKRILFAETIQGDKVLRPSMRPVAAWLSIWHDGIFVETMHREPEVLLNHGDPQSLRPQQRADVLKEYVKRFGKGGWRGLRVPAIQVHRFASTELSQTVNSIWAKGVENFEVRELIFELIGAGKLANCANIAHEVIVDGKASERERIEALDALIALDDGRLPKIAASVAHRRKWPPSLARSASLRLFPKHLSVAQLCKLLPHVQEPKKTIGDLSWRLPQVIAGGKILPAALDELRIGLTALVEDGAKWLKDKWPHTQTNRPDLVAALVASCVRKFLEGVASPELFRSSVIALRFVEDRDSASQATKDLRGFLADATSEQREAAFWEDDAFLQMLHPVTDAWNRVFNLSHHGGIRLTSKDRSWVIRRLSNKNSALLEREMMLNAAITELIEPGDNISKVFEVLKAHVADSQSLLTIVKDRQKPAPINAELRRFEEQGARRKKKEENQQAQARVSWVKFWQEVASNPEAVFAKARANNTAWNLWRAMERSGSESRASGWNRRFIEQQFGKETADRLREILQRMWRKDKPTLRSERAPENKSTFLVKWQLGLAAIYAESEDAAWATKLTDAEARLAARYAPIELNGFPPWLDALVASHPAAVDEVLGAELSLSLQDEEDSSNASISLQNVRHASPRVASLFSPRVKAWLDRARVDKVGNGDTGANLLGQAIAVLMQSENGDLQRALATAASEEVANDLQGPSAKIWLPVLMQLKPEAGVIALEETLKGVQPAKRGVGVAWFSTLFGRDVGGLTINLRRPEFTPKLLLRLVRLAYQHVRRSEDAKHVGSYSPDQRDDAERGRDVLLSALLATKGAEGWAAKLEMAADPLFKSFKDRAVAVAREGAAEEVDGVALSEVDVVAIDTYGEASPSTRDAMFAVLRDRLDDIEDLLLQDVSPREAWANIHDERVMRKELARELRNASNHLYTVDQEAATADEKETDIRMRATRSGQQGTIELKIGEKPRSAAELRATIKDQLLMKYMAADECRAGCLVITIKSNKTWSHPDTAKRLDFSQLIEMLDLEASRLSFELGGSACLLVKGLDLRPRLLTEREARMRRIKPESTERRAKKRISSKRKVPKSNAKHPTVSKGSTAKKSSAVKKRPVAKKRPTAKNNPANKKQAAVKKRKSKSAGKR